MKILKAIKLHVCILKTKIISQTNPQSLKINIQKGIIVVTKQRCHHGG